jgi:ABC-type polysaccharide/polyol phosphate transport system ATPase subunit
MQLQDQNLSGIADARQFEIIKPQPEYVIEFENVSRHYRLHHESRLTLQDRFVGFFQRKKNYEDFWALKNVSFKLEKGKTIGIIGRNGAGKSTLLKLATRVLEPSSGVVRVNGRISAMLELGTGFHPELSARDNIYLNGAFYGYNREQMDERFERIVEFSELDKFIDTPVKHYSSGMYMRLGFAVAITVDPDILVIDEVLAVGDAAFGRKCRRAIEELKEQSKAMLFVSHSAGEVSRLCDEVIYLNKGEMVAQGSPGEILDDYMTDTMNPTFLMPNKTPSAPTTKSETPVKLPEKSEVPAPRVEKLAPTPVKVRPTTLSLEEMLLPDSDKMRMPQMSRLIQTSQGIAARNVSTHWQFVLPEHLRQLDTTTLPTPETYIAVLNGVGSYTAELLGLRESSSDFDRVAGVVKFEPVTTYSVPARRAILIPLTPEMTYKYSQLLLTGPRQVSAEILEFNLNPSVPLSNPQPNLAPVRHCNFPYCDIRGENQCRFDILNPNEFGIEIKMILFRDDAEPVERLRSFWVEALANVTVDLNEELKDGMGEMRHAEKFYGAVTLESEHLYFASRRQLLLQSPRFHLSANRDL